MAGVATKLFVLVPVLILQPARGVGSPRRMQHSSSSFMGLAAYYDATGLMLGAVLHFNSPTLQMVRAKSPNLRDQNPLPIM